jgi:hypothetical protein
MSNDVQAANKTLVLAAFDTLFNKRDYEAAAAFWSPRCIQHSAHIAPGRQGLFDLVRAERWDVLQDGASQASSVSGLPMFGDAFPA